MLTAADDDFIQQAIEEAEASVRAGGFPAGAVVVKNGYVIATGQSLGNKLNDPTSHGEMGAIRNACRQLGATDLDSATLYASLEPCLMCLGGAAWANIGRIVFACRKGIVNADYYAGRYDTDNINESLHKPMAITHHAAFEEKSLAIVRQWEKGLTP